MLALVVEKGGSGLLTLFGVATVVFYLFNVLGDPAQMMLDQNASEQQRVKIQQKYGFDLPLKQQYLYFLNDISPVSIHSKNPNTLNYFSPKNIVPLVFLLENQF